MEKINKLCAVIIIIALFMSCFTSGYADDFSEIELTKIIYNKNGICTVEGKVYDKPLSMVSLYADGKEESTITGTDGGFIFEFDYYSVNSGFEIKSENGKKFVFDKDILGIVDLFKLDEKGCEIESVVFTSEGVYIYGQNSAAENAIVTMTLATKETPMEFKGFVQKKANSNGEFVLDFKVAEGEYKLSIKIVGVADAECNIFIPDIYGVLGVCDDDTDAFVNKLIEYTKTTEELINQCKIKGIPTAYEEADMEIVKTFINNIKMEAEYGDFARMSQYNYELTKICEKTVDALNGYINGEKTAFDVPKYVTGDITKDGTSLVATVEDSAGQKIQPTFFTGLMSIDDVCGDMIPQFSNMGFNATQISVNPVRFFADYNPHILNGWYHFEIGEVNSVAEITREDRSSGEKSFKIINSDGYKNDNYRRFTNYVKVKPNTTYKWGFKAKGKNINNTWFNPDNRIGKGYKYITQSDNWKSYNYEYTTKPNQTIMELTFGCEDICEYVYIDDVYVTEKGKSENLVINGGFEDDCVREKSQTDIEMEKYGWYINYFGLDWLKETLKNAEKHNFMVDILVPIDLVPNCVKEKDSTMQDSVSQFLPFTLDSETARDYVKFIAITLAEICKEYESVSSICLNNEPWLDTNNNSGFNKEVMGHYDETWQNYLREIYGNSITKLNSNYGRVYDSFDEVKMPTRIDSSAIYTDYRGFNEKLLNDFFEWYEDEVRPHTGDIDLHIKIMDYFRYNWKDPYVEGGTNYEMLQDKFDINGCDAHSYFGDSNTPLELKMGWYDFMTSVKDAPVYDTESHIVHDRKEIDYSEDLTNYYEADVWNGAVHGRAVDIIWNYDTVPKRSAVGGSNYANANMAHRPAELSRIAKTSLDLQRLANEITALQKTEANVGLMYSWANLTINENHMKEVASAYKDIIFSGQKVEMVTDSKPQNVEKYDLLIVPDVIYADSEMLDNVASYIKNGGEVFLLGNNSFTCDKYGKKITSPAAEYIRQNADNDKSVKDKIREMNMSEIRIVDFHTGKDVDDVEWSYASYGDKYIVNILNYDSMQEKDIKILLNGNTIKNVTELRSGEMYENGCITAEGYKPILISFEQFSFDKLDGSGNVVKENIDVLESGKIRCNVQADGSVIMALYRDNVLVDIIIGKDTMDVDLSNNGNYRLMATVWNMQNISPASASRSIYTIKCAD